MLLTTELAQPIVNKIMKVIDYNINIMNKNGIIVASGDSLRMNQIHHGAIQVLKIQEEIIIYDIEDINRHRLVGTKPGVNLPIHFQKEIIGVVGITDDPNEIYKIAHIVKVTVETLIQQQYVDRRIDYKQNLIEEWGLDLINPDFKDYKDLKTRSSFLKVALNEQSAVLKIELDVKTTSKIDFYDWFQAHESSIYKTLHSFPRILHFI